MPRIPKQHFDEDIDRASQILRHSRRLPSGQPRTRLLRGDLLRSAWMFAVGALDAYFCDAYASILTGTLQSKSLQSSVRLPRFIQSIELPIGAILADYPDRPNWRWRMAVRALMEKDNVLSLKKVQLLFNPFFRDGNNMKFFNEVLDAWVPLPGMTARIIGMSVADYANTNGPARNDARKEAAKKMRARFGDIFQRRHDCIHNCDRPKVSPQPIETPGTITNVINDVRFLVQNCNQHIDGEFRRFLTQIGCDATTRNAVGY